MPTIKSIVTWPIHDSFRVQQVAGMFDVPLAEKATERFEADVPGANENWQIGLIVGPSGSGKSTIARRAFAAKMYSADEWPNDRAVIDCFGELSVRHVVELFTAVGFSRVINLTPQAWRAISLRSGARPVNQLVSPRLSRGFTPKTPGRAGGCRLSAMPNVWPRADS